MYHVLQISPHMRCVLRKKQILCKPLYCRIDCHFIRTILRLRPRHHIQTNLSAFCSPAPQSGVCAVCHQQCTSISCYPGLFPRKSLLINTFIKMHVPAPSRKKQTAQTVQDIKPGHDWQKGGFSVDATSLSRHFIKKPPRHSREKAEKITL